MSTEHDPPPSVHSYEEITAIRINMETTPGWLFDTKKTNLFQVCAGAVVKHFAPSASFTRQSIHEPQG